MSKNVTIVYNGRTAEVERRGAPICSLFMPFGSYVDTPVFTEGYANPGTIGDGKSYEKSIYATNVHGMGLLYGLCPMFSYTGRLAWFERAIWEAADGEADGVTFSIEGAEEELWWMQIANAMEGQGFTVTIEDEVPPNEEEEPEKEPEA